MKDKRPVYIYALIDPRNETVRYIGQTCDPLSRLSAHKSNKGNRQKMQWVQELRTQGYSPKMKILEKTTRAEGRERELYWIYKHALEGAQLTNVRGVSTALSMFVRPTWWNGARRTT